MEFEQAKQYILNRLSKELSPTLYYHGLHHTIDVYDAVIRIAEEEQITTEELLLLKTAALFHDAGFIEQYLHNEPIGVRIANETLPGFDYNKEQIETIAAIIMATNRQTPPQTLLQKIMCDADLDYLGRDDFYTIADTLRKELNAHGHTYSDLQWLQMQVAFLENHEYYTMAAKKKNNKTKSEHLVAVRKKLNVK